MENGIDSLSPSNNWDADYVRSQAIPLTHLACAGAADQLRSSDIILGYDLASGSVHEFYCQKVNGKEEQEFVLTVYSYNSNYEDPRLLKVCVAAAKQPPGKPQPGNN